MLSDNNKKNVKDNLKGNLHGKSIIISQKVINYNNLRIVNISKFMKNSLESPLNPIPLQPML